MQAVPAAPTAWCSVGPKLRTARKWALSCSSMITNCQSFVLDLVAAFEILYCIVFFDFKLSPCFICNAFSFGYLPGVRVLKADVSEHFIGSIFIGRSMKYNFFWVSPRRPSAKSRRFGTLYRFHLHRQVDEV